MAASVPQYVTELINEIAKNEKFENYSISNKSDSNNGDGLQSIILKFLISGTRNGQNDAVSLICKMPAFNIIIREIFQSDAIFRREIYFYEQVFPYFEKFQNDRGVSRDDGFFAYPKCYGAVNDNKMFGDHMVALENLNDKGYQMWNKVNDIDLAHSILVLQELGKLHAVSFAIRDQEPEKMKEFTQIRSEFHEKISELETTKILQKNHFSRVARSLDPSETALIERINQLKETYLDLVKEIKSGTSCEPFRVLLHGDCWINNLLYSYDEAGQPSKVCLIDWQLSEYGSPALDLSCYLFCSLSPELRSAHYDDLLNVYYNSLVLTMGKLGSDASKLFTYEDLQDQLKLFSKYTLFLAPIMIGIMTSDPNNVPSMDKIAAKMEKLKENPKADIHLNDIYEENDKFRHRMSNLIRDLVRMGYW